MKLSSLLSTMVFCFSTVVFTEPVPKSDLVLTVATTTSTQASGLFDVLLPAFEQDTGIRVKVVAKGTGAAIRDGQDGNVDLILVHAKGREEEFVKQGYGTVRFAVMHNDFVILGPKSDPAGIRGLKDGAEALTRIARQKWLFTSRGDDSGTHTKEQELWRRTGLGLVQEKLSVVKKGKKHPLSSVRPKGNWYLAIGQGMGKALTFADEKQTYILVDRGTYLKYRYGRAPAIELVVLVEGDPLLANPYGAIPVNPERHPHVRHQLALRFARWLVSERARALISRYKLHGRQLFLPDRF